MPSELETLKHEVLNKNGLMLARENELSVLKAVRLFGHLRRSEIALAVWPESSPSVAYQMACKTVSRMVRGNLLLPRQNSIGGTSFVLTKKGATLLRAEGYEANAGYSQSYDGAQFLHRTLGTYYLLEKKRQGYRVFGEYAIQRGWSGVRSDMFKADFQKLPDGLIFHEPGSLGFRDEITPVDWIEVEQAYKPVTEIKKALAVLTKRNSIDRAGFLALNKLVFVYRTDQSHETRIIQAIKSFLGEHPELSPEIFMESISMVRCVVRAPMQWESMSEHSAAGLMKL
jgi:hypothetical protein